MANLVAFVERVEHDDGADVVFVDHAPQVDDGVRQRHLRQDVRVATLIALKRAHNNSNEF